VNRILLTPPSIEPVTIQDLTEHARIDTDTDDDLLTFLIQNARQWCENYTRIAFIEQEWLISYDQADLNGTSREIDLRQGNISDVESVTSYNTSDEAAVIDDENYRASFQRIIFAQNIIKPYQWREFDALQIQYTVGYGDAAEDVPTPIRQAIKMLATYWYEAREAIGDMMGKSKEEVVPFGVQSLLIPYKRFVV
jgi:uncharacterized phiE125 gp8 family phage protein